MSEYVKATFKNVGVGDEIGRVDEDGCVMWEHVVHTIDPERESWTYLISESYYDKKYAGKPCSMSGLDDYVIIEKAKR